MSSQAASVVKNEDVFIAEVEAMRSQVVLLQKRTPGDDLTTRLFDTVLSTVDSLLEGFNARLDTEADDYNALVDRFEAYQEAANKAMSTLSLIISGPVTIETFAQCIFDLKQAHSEMLDQVATKHQQLVARVNATEVEFRQYKKTYPPSLHERIDRTEKENRSLKKERRELKELVTELNQKFVKKTADLTARNRALTLAEAKVEELRGECHQLGHELNVAVGMESVPEAFSMLCNGQEAVGYIHTFPYGLAATSDQRQEILTAAEIHFQIRTTRLISMDVLPSVWGAPLYVRLPGFAEEWNRGIDECLSDKIMAYIETDFPRLHKRIEDSRLAPVEELKMRPATLELIKETGFDTVYSVACIPAEFHENIPFMQGECRQEIIDACRVWANEWDKANGGVEDLYRKPKVKSLKR
ncbi:hypothetical protein RZQ20_21910 [Raoultella ornithinolytica]|uniref:hypothetical protein n=1 Tax=Raoultella ornithinolytica TaxID=54291 RepID=UPI00292B45CC|nr:hypothetical protein [Raoultella ornithinolytica]MDV1094922.1 hypothetical protein [Raoultella ornithinolytica]MDV1122734.1 hypothetical protein [Raoultella ornithinolytica]MDV1893249.1 hypothetical protein [Raoultella ornithinolytica]